MLSSFEVGELFSRWSPVTWHDVKWLVDVDKHTLTEATEEHSDCGFFFLFIHGWLSFLRRVHLYPHMGLKCKITLKWCFSTSIVPLCLLAFMNFIRLMKILGKIWKRFGQTRASLSLVSQLQWWPSMVIKSWSPSYLCCCSLGFWTQAPLLFSLHSNFHTFPWTDWSYRTLWTCSLLSFIWWFPAWE